MLKKIRLLLSLLLFALLGLHFLDFRGFLPDSVTILTAIQFLPALLSLNILALLSLLLLTLLFGRIYCSSICPMGVYQDIVVRLSDRKSRKKYKYKKGRNILRWSIVAALTVSSLFGFTLLPALLDPYGAFGRIVTHLFRPLFLAGNNLLVTIATSFNNHTFYKVNIYSFSFTATIIAVITLLTIGYIARRGGRTWCNTICPVGTILGFISRFSLFKVRFINENCNSCGLCAMKCKASCIDITNREIDWSRCVTCFNCIESCNRDAIKYSHPIKAKSKEPSTLPTSTKYIKANTLNAANPGSNSRRRFLSATMIAAATTLKLQAEEITGHLTSKREPKRKVPIAPPGALSFQNLRERCISCHLCVSKCPSHVIKPALLEYGLGGIMQPRLNFDHGFCNYNCTVCGDICPTGAIIPLTVEQKNHTAMGQVHFIIENCIVYYDETSCGACSEHCPTQAVHMVPHKGHLTIPQTDPSICIGCGACEYICPAIPFKAIYVEGLYSQNIIEIEHIEVETIVIDDFGF